MDNKVDIKNYKKLFEMCLEHSSSVFVLLNKDLTIQDVSPQAEEILDWDRVLVRKKNITEVFKNNLTEPFIDIKNPTANRQNTTYIFKDDYNLKITWDIVPIYDANKNCELILIIGNMLKELGDKCSKDLGSERHVDMVRKNLPENDGKLFELGDYPLLDVEWVLKSINHDELLLKDIFKSMANDEIPRDLEIMGAAKVQSDWASIEKIAHKMKGGAMYCGTTKMQYACLHFEKYNKSGNRNMLDSLYDQLIQVCMETETAIKMWLSEHS